MSANKVALPNNCLVESIEVSITRDDQDVNYYWLTNIDGHKVRFSVRSNPYSFQCHARAEIWSPAKLGWNEVAHLTEGERETPPKLVYKRDWQSPDPFQADIDHLLRRTLATLL